MNGCALDCCAQEWSAQRPAVASLVFVLVRAARDAAQFRRVYELLAALCTCTCTCTLLSLDEPPLHSCQLPLSAAVPDRIRQCLVVGFAVPAADVSSSTLTVVPVALHVQNPIGLTFVPALAHAVMARYWAEP